MNRTYIVETTESIKVVNAVSRKAAKLVARQRGANGEFRSVRLMPTTREGWRRERARQEGF